METGNVDGELDRLFFAMLVSENDPELTLDGLPLFGDQVTGKTRRTLSGFRRHLRKLDQEHPDRNVFVEDKNQNKFEEELASHGIDPQVFYYQIRMNEREGGVSKRFSFASDEDFVDFLLEMTFDQRHARQVHEQLSTFRQEIVERNEQLKPELEYCQGLIARLHKLAGIASERADVFRQTSIAQGGLQNLADWITSRSNTLQAEASRIEADVDNSRLAADKERQAGDLAGRWAAVQQLQACRLRLHEAQSAYEASERARLKAKRQKEIGQATVPLARVWDARREATRHRNLLQQKLAEFAPDLNELIEIATSFANALEQDAVTLRDAEQTYRSELLQCREAADKTHEEIANEGERAAQNEMQAKNFESQLIKAQEEELVLHQQAVLTPEDTTVLVGLGRVNEQLATIEISLNLAGESLRVTQTQLAETKTERGQAEFDRVAIEREQDRAQESWGRATSQRISLEADATLLRLLQTDHVDVEVAATSATTQASDELRRVTDGILRIGVEAAEDERAIHGLTESELLPPSQDVQTLLDWLRKQNVTCWSGFEYFQSNITLRERRSAIHRLPQIAAGVVVANSDYDRVVELFSSTEQHHPTYRSRTPVVIAPADALRDGQEILWVVVGPTSDAHFDKAAGAQELTRLLSEKSNRQKEVEQHQEWRDALTKTRHRLQQFQNEYPRGWFSDHRQKLDIVASRLEETSKLVFRLSAKQQTLESDVAKSGQEIQALSKSRDRLFSDRERLEQFERSFGRHSDGWRKDLIASRESTEKARQRQAELRQMVSALDQKTESLLERANTAFLQAAQLNTELVRVKHSDDGRRMPTAGQTEVLRAQYELLLADYEGKVNADALSRLAEAKDQEAEREEREFQRILAKLTQYSADEVTAKLHEMPEGVTAQQQLEEADTAFYEATRKLGPLKNRLNSIKVEFDTADQKFQELSKTASMPVLDMQEAVDVHLAKAAEARKVP